MSRTDRVATVVMARCANTKQPYGIRVEKMQNTWVCTWAFKLEERAAKREGYDEVRVQGQISFTDDFPGCPHCGSRYWFSCGKCGRITCQRGDETQVVCAWCSKKLRVQYGESFDLQGGGY